MARIRIVMASLGAAAAAVSSIFRRSEVGY